MSAPLHNYEKRDQSLSEIVYLDKFKLSSNDKYKNLRKIYAIPKLHKNPYKFRFRAGSRFCSTKEWSVLLTKGLQKVQEIWYNYCGRIEATSGNNRFWIINNSKEMLDMILVNKNLPYKDITPWDFSTLYTTIPHSDLKCVN